MSDLAFDDVQALNRQLANLADVGIPLHLDSDIQTAALPDTLKQINASLSLRTSLGQSLSEAVAENQELPLVYRHSLSAGLLNKRLSTTLEGVSRQASAENEIRTTIARSLLSPLIVLAIGYFGFIFICLNFAPTLEGMYEQVGQPLSQPATFLATMRAWLPYWAIMLPLLTLVTFWLGQRHWKTWQKFVPSNQRYVLAVRNAIFAHQLAELMENNIPLVESLPMAAGVTGDAELLIASTKLSDAMRRQETLTDNDETLHPLPPLLRWALISNLDTQSLTDVLRFTEKSYRQVVQRLVDFWQVALPACIGALLGGFIVLAYALSLFIPFIRLLKDLSF